MLNLFKKTEDPRDTEEPTPQDQPPPQAPVFDLESIPAESVPFTAIKGAKAALAALERAQRPTQAPANVAGITGLHGSAANAAPPSDAKMLAGLYAAFRCLAEGTAPPAPPKPQPKPAPPRQLNEHQRAVKAAVHTLARRHQKLGIYNSLVSQMSEIIWDWPADQQELLLHLADAKNDSEFGQELQRIGATRTGDPWRDKQRIDQARAEEEAQVKAVALAFEKLREAGVPESKLASLSDREALTEARRLGELGLF